MITDMLHRGLDVFSFKNYCVTVMDGETSLRLFWTREGALKWRDKIGDHAHAYRWHRNIGQWLEMSRPPSRCPHDVDWNRCPSCCH